MLKAILLDNDGTLLDSMPRAFEAICHVFEKSGLSRPVFVDVCRELRAPFFDFYRNRGVVIGEDVVQEWYLSVLKQGTDHFFEDSYPTLNVLHSTGLKLGIVSARGRDEIIELYKPTEMYELLASIEGGHQHKVAPIRSCCERMGLKPHEVAYVGDMCCDMHHALEAGVIPIGITRCHPTRGLLMDAGARLCVDHLSDLLVELDRHAL